MKLLLTLLLCLTSMFGFSQRFLTKEAKLFPNIDSSAYKFVEVSASIVLTDSTITMVDLETMDTTVIKMVYEKTMEFFGAVGKMYDGEDASRIIVFIENNKPTVLSVRRKNRLVMFKLISLETPTVLGKS